MSDLAGNLPHVTVLNPPYNPDAERSVSADLLTHVLWLLEQHESRSESARKAAVTVLTTTGALAALVPKALPASPAAVLVVLLLFVGAAAIVTFVLCILVLLPRPREKGLPAVKALRELVASHNSGLPLPVPLTQAVVDLTNAGKLDELSPLDHASTDADYRMTKLSWSYIGLAVTLALALLLTSATALIHQ
jgi:hypothetical protein